MKKFSLMELLVVMGILLLMMSLLLPTVAPMMNRAELNKTVTTIIGQLEVGYVKSLEKSQVSRVSFEYDPVGKGITKADVTTISGMASKTDGDELLARQSNKFDINNDGVSAGYGNNQFFWIQMYLVPYLSGSVAVPNHSTTPYLKDCTDMVAGIPVNVAQGPFWFRRPISRMKDANGTYKSTKINVKDMRVIDENGCVFLFRPLINDGLDIEKPEKLAPVEADGTCYLIKDTGSTLNYNLKADEMKLEDGNSGVAKTYADSVALFKTKGGSREQFLYGKEVEKFYQDKATKSGKPEDAVYDTCLDWFNCLEGGDVDVRRIDAWANDDEDRLIDEGMSVSVECYNQSGMSPPVRLPAGDIYTYNVYFSAIEDNSLKVGREYFIGGKDRKGVMLRRVWGIKPGKNDKVLLWSFNEIIKPPAPFDKIDMSVPNYFYIVFDKKNGDSGMSFGSAFGSTQVGKLFFQVSDDDGKLYSIIEFTNGVAKEGTLTEMGFPSSKASLDALGYYQGAN